MIISIHQPAYLPWLGYFDKIIKSDIFVYLDTVQFEKNSFINRNRIKTPQGSQWLTIPVKTKGHIGSTLRDTEIDDKQPWRKKHLKAIAMNYRRAAHFAENFPKFEALITNKENRLAEFCWMQLEFLLNEFGINTQIVKSSELNITSCKSDLVLDICRHFEATHYLSGELGRDYLDEIEFVDNGIVVEYQDFVHPKYDQLYREFEPYMGCLDYMMNCGTDFKMIFGE